MADEEKVNVTVVVRQTGMIQAIANTGLPGPIGPRGDKGELGPEGPQGEPGTGIAIRGSLASVDLLPDNPDPDEAYIIEGNLYVYSPTEGWLNVGSVQGPEGPEGPVGPVGPQGPPDEFRDVYEQVSPSDFWAINHNLQGYPSVTIVDTSGTVHEGAVHYIDENNINVSFTSGFAGEAYLS